MITRIAHVCLNVADLERSLHFYTQALGLAQHFTFTKKGDQIGAYVQVAPGNFIEMFVRKDLQVQNTGITHFCLEVDDIDAAIEQLRAHGVEPTPKKLGCDQSWQTWISDPDGNRIELHHYTPRSAQHTAKDVEVDW